MNATTRSDSTGGGEQSGPRGRLPCETSGRQDRPHHEPPAGSENRMNSRSLRGTRLGSLSMETDEGVLAAPRQEAVYDCPNGHTIVLPFSVEADVRSEERRVGKEWSER